MPIYQKYVGLSMAVDLPQTVMVNNASMKHDSITDLGIQ